MKVYPTVWDHSYSPCLGFGEAMWKLLFGRGGRFQLLSGISSVRGRLNLINVMPQVYNDAV